MAANYYQCFNLLIKIIRKKHKNHNVENNVKNNTVNLKYKK